MIKRVLQTVIDIETYGVTSNAPIASIGIVDFYIGDEFKIENTFYRNIDQTMNQKINRRYDESTLNWWKEQNKEVQKALMEDQRPLDEVIEEMYTFIHPKSIVWCQGLDFDIPIIKSTMHALGYDKFPWNFRNVRCSRTLSLSLGFDMKDFRDSNTHHNALEDAIAQAKGVNHIMNSIEKSMK